MCVIASQSIKNFMFADDHLGRVNSEGEAIELIEQLYAATQQSGLELRKWTTKSSKLLLHISEELHELQT